MVATKALKPLGVFMIGNDVLDRRIRTAALAEQGEAWVEKKRDELEALPSRTVVLIDVRTGQYTTGKSWLEARAAFDSRFGSEIAGYVHRVRDRTFVGGGIG
jgi:hypothetical protein